MRIKDFKKTNYVSAPKPNPRLTNEQILPLLQLVTGRIGLTDSQLRRAFNVLLRHVVQGIVLNTYGSDRKYCDSFITMIAKFDNILSDKIENSEIFLDRCEKLIQSIESEANIVE